MSREVYSVHRFRRALLQFVGGRIGQLVARAVLVLALVRILPVADYGAYMLVVGTAELLLQVGSCGILPLAQRYLPQLLTTVPLHKLYRFVGFLIAAQFVVLTVIAGILGWYWELIGPVFGLSQDQIARTSLAPWLFLVVPAFRFTSELLEAMLAQGQTARALMELGRAAAVIVLVLVKPHVGLTDILKIDLLSMSLSLVLSWTGIRQTMLRLHTPGASGTLPVREMYTFAWHMALVGPMSGTAMPGAIRLALASGLGVAQSGLFAFLQNLERLVSRYLPATLIRNLIRPVLIARAIGEGRTAMLKSSTWLLLKSNMLAVVAGMVVIAVCGDRLVYIMSGHKFSGAGLTLLLLYVNMIAASQRGVQEMVMQITGHTRALWVTTVVSPIALFMVWLFAKHGLNVAVLIITAGSMSANWLASWVLHARTDWFRVDWRGISAIFLPGLAAGGAGMFMALWMNPLYAAAIATPLYVLLLRVARPFNEGEIRVIERAVGQRVAKVLRGFAL